MRYRNAILATALAVTPPMLATKPTSAVAQPITGIYVGAGVGLHAPQDPRVSPRSPGFGNGRITLDEGFGFKSNLAVGYGIGTGFRFEIEGDFARSDLRHITGTPFPAASGNGHVRTFGVMVNALYDLDIGIRYIFPYLGGGVGYQWTTLNNVNATQVNGPFRFATNNNHEGALAMQAIVGASFPIPNVPGLSLTADYRFMDITGGEKFGGAAVLRAGGPTVSSGLKLHNQFNHDLVVGVRYAFYAPSPAVPMAPAPVAAPAPTPARSYLVFFDWDKANLTDRARTIIKEAADNSTHVHYTRIEVNGYTDTTGTQRYNQRLSIRRARAVAGELVRDGVAQSTIAIQGFGQTHLLVSTGPNVREPQNRRVEIIIR